MNRGISFLLSGVSAGNVNKINPLGFRIFERLFRASNALIIDKEGNGLGLYIVQKVIIALGGKVWFTSKEGQGTTFYFELPIKNHAT